MKVWQPGITLQMAINVPAEYVRVQLMSTLYITDQIIWETLSAGTKGWICQLTQIHSFRVFICHFLQILYVG